jgi:hypothetical protein
MKLYLSLAVIAVAVSSCNLLGGRCTYEVRSFDGIGNALQGGASAATAQVNLSEQRGSIVRQTFVWSVTGGLKGHVTSASFKDSQNPSVVLLDLPVLGPDRDPILEGIADSRDGATVAGFHDILAAGHGGIELITDDPSASAVVIPITTVNASGWVRPYCS